MFSHGWSRRCVWAGIALTLALGCATKPYQFGHFERASSDGAWPEVQVEFGKPNKTLDRIGRIVGMPARILPLNSKINNHQVSPETLATLKTYLELNDLTDVAVFVNYYDPKQQWERMKSQQLVGPGWRYTLGMLSWLGYTVFPSRVFGGDDYNPYTNSISVNSDVPAVILAQAAFAKNVHARKLPGTYAAINDLPLLSLGGQRRALADVLGYAQAQGNWELEKQTYHVLYPRMGAQIASVGTPLVGVWWAGPALSLSGAAVGHAAGRSIAAYRAPAAKALEAAPPEPTPIPLREAPGESGASTTQLVSFSRIPPLCCPWFDPATGSWRELELSQDW